MKNWLKTLKYLAITGLLLSSLILLGKKQSTFLPDTTLDQARAYFAKGEYSAAESSYKEALQSSPENSQPAMELAQLYYMWDRPQEGLLALETAAQRGAPQELVAALRIKLLAQSGHWTQTLLEARARLDAAPQDSEAHALLLAAYFELEDCTAAEEAAAKWVAVQPENIGAQNIHAYLTGDTQTLCRNTPAMCDYIKNCAPDCALKLGLTLVQAQEWPQARCLLLQSVAQNPGSAAAHAWLGQTLASLNHPQAALEQFLAATSADPDYPLGWLFLGQHYLRLENFSEARLALLRAQELSSDAPEPCLAIAELKMLEGLYDEIELWIDAAVERAPDDVNLWKSVSRFYLERNLRQGKYPLHAAEKVMEIAPQDAEAHLLLGWALMIYEDSDGAISAFDEAIHLAPNEGLAHYLRGFALQMTGDNAAAQAAFTRAADLGYRP